MHDFTRRCLRLLSVIPAFAFPLLLLITVPPLPLRKLDLHLRKSPYKAEVHHCFAVLIGTVAVDDGAESRTGIVSFK